MKHLTSRLITAALLATGTPLVVAAERSATTAANDSQGTHREWQVDMRGKPPFKRRLVTVSGNDEPIQIVSDESGSLGRVGPPARSPRTRAKEVEAAPAGENYADFARFEEVEEGERTETSTSARRYLGAPGKHRRVPLDKD